MQAGEATVWWSGGIICNVSTGTQAERSVIRQVLLDEPWKYLRREQSGGNRMKQNLIKSGGNHIKIRALAEQIRAVMELASETTNAASLNGSKR